MRRRISFDGNKVTNLTWMAPDHTLTCWEKAHQYYIPMGLFWDNVNSVTVEEISNKKIKFQCMCLSSKPYKRKLEAMGREQEVRGSRRNQVSVPAAKRRRTARKSDCSDSEDGSTLIAVPVDSVQCSDNDSHYDDALNVLEDENLQVEAV